MDALVVTFAFVPFVEGGDGSAEEQTVKDSTDGTVQADTPLFMSSMVSQCQMNRARVKSSFICLVIKCIDSTKKNMDTHSESKSSSILHQPFKFPSDSSIRRGIK